MKRARHKRKKSRLMLMISDSVDDSLQQYKYHPWLTQSIIMILCIVIGALIGVCYFEAEVAEEQKAIGESYRQEIAELQAELADAHDDNTVLVKQIEELEYTIQLLSQTVKQKTENEASLVEQIEKQALPTGFPMNGSTTMELSEDQTTCIIYPGKGDMVIATAAGTVTAVNDEEEYGHNVWVDHGNGYVTIYRNPGEVKVKKGETVKAGTTLIIVEKDDTKLIYQMLKNGSHINPMELLSING